VNNEEMQRAQNQFRRLDADWALVSSPANVTYVSHFEVPVPHGWYGDTAYAPALCLMAVGHAESYLVVNNYFDALVEDRAAIDAVLSYEVLNWGRNVSPRDGFLTSLREALRRAGLGQGHARLAIEERSLPVVAQRLLAEEFPGLELVEGGEALRQARLCKTAREIELLRRSAEINAIGQNELVRQLKQPGQHEMAVWGAVSGAMQVAAGRELCFFIELIVGRGCAVLGGVGDPRGICREGDLALLDLNVRLNGYWSDTTNTLRVGSGEPTEDQRRCARAAREAFYAGAEALRPGRRACDVHAVVQSALQAHGFELVHHAGHQIGAAVIEPPELLPWDETVIEPGMVFSVEPGVYQGPDGTAGARMEKQVIVHASGPEVFCDFEWGL
jgi:Xaa-Pro dipeptidase